MKYMNGWDVELAVQRTAARPVQNKAARFLYEYMEQVNAHSDGWAYWAAPVRSAARLMSLVESPVEITEQQFRSALIPIKSFYTRRGRAAGMTYPEVL